MPNCGSSRMYAGMRLGVVALLLMLVTYLCVPSAALGVAAEDTIQGSRTVLRAAPGTEFRIGGPVTIQNMTIAANYLVGIEVAPMPPGMPDPAAQNVVHLEADVHATSTNPWGFPNGSWIPYLSIVYTISKEGSSWSARGVLSPMTADDGPHYADSLTLAGPGRYALIYKLIPPQVNGFLRHVDHATGVPDWWTPFEVPFNFTYPVETASAS